MRQSKHDSAHHNISQHVKSIFPTSLARHLVLARKPIQARQSLRVLLLPLMLGIGSPMVQAQVPRFLRTIIEVSYPNTDYELGTGMLGLGDINRDGKPDFAVGARKIQKAFIYFGGKGVLGSTVDLVLKGGMLMAMGDLNGDGLKDLVTSGQDTLFVYFGRSDSPLAIDTVPGLVVGREAEGGGEPMFGDSFALGDINCDGLDDLIVGAPGFLYKGKVYVYLGKTSPSATPDFTVLCDSLGSHFGSRIRTGDINGDGVNDLTIGSYIRSINSSPSQRWSQLDIHYGRPGWTFGKDTYDQRLDSREGLSENIVYSNLVDVNSDGRSDISFTDGSKSYFILGRTDSVLHLPDKFLTNPDTSFVWGFLGPFFDIGDINKDSVSDFAVSVSPTGCLVVYLGSSWPQPIAARCKGFVGNGFYIIVPLGDVNEDGVNDFGTTAPYDLLGNPPQDGWFIVLSGDPSFVVTSIDSAYLSLPLQSGLAQNYPNPFNPTTTIEYTLPKSGHVVLRIYDSSGKEVRTLVDESQPGGFHRIQWDGRSFAGNPVVSGAYFYTLAVDGTQLGVGKSLLTK